MSERRFENFSKRLNERPHEDLPATGPLDPANPETPDDPDEPDSPEKEGSMTEVTQAAVDAARKEGHAEGVAEGRKAEQTRMTAVFTHENTKGREAHAARLLGRSMTAEEITAELEHFPKAEALSTAEQREAAEEGGRKEMRSELDKSENVDLGATKDADATSVRARSTARWDKANAKVLGTKKEA